MEMQVFYNGKVFTADEEKYAEAFVIENGMFVYVGDSETAKTYGEGIDLLGKTVLPGLIDSHCHIIGGYETGSVDMIILDPDEVTPDNLNEILLRACRENDKNPEEIEKISAYGYYLTKGDISKWNADCIGREFDKTAVFIFSMDGHSMLANRRAFMLAGITKDTKDPSESSYFVRDDEGNPTGLIVEIAAMKKLSKVLQDENIADVEKLVTGVCNLCSSLGITACFDANTTEAHGKEWVYETLQKINANMHIVTSHLYEQEDDLEETISRMKYFKSQYRKGNLYPNVLKIIYDGVIESHTAYLNESYEDARNNFGGAFFSKENAKAVIDRALEEGFDVHVHAIGDRAAGDISDIFEKTKKAGRKTIAHCQLVDGKAFEKLKGRKDVFFQTTPQWVIDDEYTKKYLGKKRYEKQFMVRTAQKNGLTVAFGSDTTNEEFMLNPFVGMYYAVNRGEEGTFPSKSEAIDVKDAVLAYTANGAKLLGVSDITGSIKENLSADFVIIDRDIFSIPKEEIKDINVEKTYFMGNCVYDRANEEAAD